MARRWRSWRRLQRLCVCYQVVRLEDLPDINVSCLMAIRALMHAQGVRDEDDPDRDACPRREELEEAAEARVLSRALLGGFT